ncbi:MAG: hypothetical protein M9899_07305 [Bdellovibrionaceae bacterium]|nr:hypothetical protein [Pseudobdellovibrionaceae bacterium]
MNVKSLGLGILFLSLAGCGGFSASKVGALISIVAPMYTNQTSVEVHGKCDPRKEEPVTLSGNFATSPLDALCEDKAYTATIPLHEEETTVVVDQAGASAQATIIFDNVPPEVHVTFPVPSGVIGSNVYVSGTCESGLPVELSGDMNRSVTTPCTDGQFIANVVMNLEPAEGSRSLTATQVDLATNVGTVDATYTFDNTIPSNPSLTLTVTNPYTAANPVISTDTSPSLAGSVVGADNGRVHVYEVSNCSGIPKTSITVPVGGALSTILSYASDGSDDGIHRYYARALGANGVASPNNCLNTNQSYRLDTQPPNVTLTSHANGARVRAGVQQTFRGACETGLPVTLKVGSETFTLNCSGRSYSRSMNMPNEFGPLTITYSQTDFVGNSYTGSTTIEITEKPDNTPPELNFINLSAGDQLVKGQLFGLTGLCDPDLPLQVSGNALASPVNVTCSSAGVFMANVTITQNTGNNLTVEARQTDLSGNQGRYSVRIRVVNPEPGNGPYITIASPLASSNYGVGAPIVISGVCTANLSVSITGMALATEYTTPCTGAGTYSVTASVAAQPGEGLLIIASQNDGVYTGDYSTPINILTAPTHPSPPPVKLMSPVDGTNYNISSQILVAGTCAYGLPVNISGAALTATTQATCTSAGTFFEILQVISTPQSHAGVVVTQVNNFGEVGMDLANLNIVENTEDVNPPNLTISAPSNDSSHEASSVITVSGACENGSDVNIMGAALSGFHTATCTAGNYSALVPTTSVGGNSLSVIAAQGDAAGNFKVASRNIRITVPSDNTAPDVKITFPTDGLVINRNSYVVVTGTCEGGLNVAITGTALASGGNVDCQLSGTFSKVLSISNVAAVNRTIVATQKDASNNTGQSTVTVDVGFNPDIIAPNVTISNPAANSEHQNGRVITISGSCQSGIPVFVTGSALADSAVANCSSGSYTTGVMASSSGGDDLDIIAYQIDESGNVGVAQRTVNVYVVPNPNPPSLTVDFPIANETYGRGGIIVVAGQCIPGYQVSISGNALARSSRVSCPSGGSYSLITNLRNSAATNATIMATQRDNFWRLYSAFVRVNVSSQPPPPAPEISIVNPAPSAVIDAGANIPIQGVCVTGGSAVYILGSAIGKTITTACNANSFSINTNVVPYTQLNSSLIAIQINSGALSYASNVVHVQRPPVPVPPVVSFTTPANNSTIVQGTKVTVTGSCSTGLAVDLYGTAITSSISTGCLANGTFSTQVTITTAIGAKTLTARQVNIAGQVGTASRNFNIIETPALDISSPLAGSSFIRGVGITVDGDCRPGVTVEITGNAVLGNPTTGCGVDGRFGSSVNLVNVVANNLNVTVRQNVAPGYIATDSVKINTVAIPVNPQVTISDPEDNSSHQSGSAVQITGTCTAGYNVTVSGTGLANPVTTPCTNEGTYVANAFVVTLPEPEPPDPEDPEEPGEEEEEEEQNLIVRAEQNISGNIGFREITVMISTNSSYSHCGSNVMKDCSIDGRGKESNPYLIGTYSCLDNIRVLSNRKCHYRLSKNITAPSNSNWEPLGTYIKPFTGSIDGAGRKIIGLKINRQDTTDVGLIGAADGATIKNLTLENVDVRGKQYVGAVVGYGEDGTTIDNVHLRGKITVRGSASNSVGVRAGGIAGFLEGSMRNCTINGEGSAQSGQDDEVTEIKVSGMINTRYNGEEGHRVGGFVGDMIGNMSNNKAQNAAIRMDVSGYIYIYENDYGKAGHRVGGIVGRLNATSSAMSNNYVFTENSFEPGIVAPIVVGDIYVERSERGLNGHRVGGLIGESGAGVIDKSSIQGINTTNVAGSFWGTVDDNTHRNTGHTVGFILGSNINASLVMDKVYLELPQDLEDPPIDPVTGKPIYDIPELAMRVVGDNGVHDVGGLIGETIVAPLFSNIHVQSAAMKVESISNRGNHVGGLIGSVYANSYSGSSSSRFGMSIAYISGLNSQIIARCNGTLCAGNKIGGAIGRMAYTRNPSGSDKSKGFDMIGVAVDGYATISSYGTHGEHYVGGLIGQMIEPHALSNTSNMSRLRRSFVSEMATLNSTAPNTIMGGLIGEYQRRDNNEYTGGGSSLQYSFLVENTHSHAAYVLPQTAASTSALGFIMGRCNMGNVNRGGQVVYLRRSYGAPVDGIDIPEDMVNLSGVIGVSTGTNQGPAKCHIQDTRYGHASGIPAQACLGCGASGSNNGLTETQLRNRALFPMTWSFNNDTPPPAELIWTMDPIPFLIVDPDLDINDPPEDEG